MTEEQEMCLRDINVLLSDMRRVQEDAAVLRCKYRHLEKKFDPSEKNFDLPEKNQVLINMILGRLDIIQDTCTTNRVIMKSLLRQLDPPVESV